MNNLQQRMLTGIALVAVIIIAVRVHVYCFIGLILTINVLGLLEFYRLFSADTLLPGKITGTLLSLYLIISLTLIIRGLYDWKIALINIPLAFIIFIIELYGKAVNPFGNLAFTFLGIICITVPLCFFTGIALWPVASSMYDYKIILGYFFLLWAGDAGAYFIGTNFGRHHLFARISPKKTWEGSVGGLICAGITACLNAYFYPGISLGSWIIMAVIIIVTGTYGDLIKSLMKRTLKVKDSGKILPGHGGMLDRFDTLLGSAPFVFSYLILFRYE